MSIPRHQLVELARWVTSGDLDLRRFYRIAACHPAMGPIAKKLRGLKPLRPPSLFEMALIAITEQQLSLAAAFHIRTRLVKRFGKPIEQVPADREQMLETFRAALEPLRNMLSYQPFIGGASPLFADYIVFGAFQWARIVSPFKVLATDDPVAAWFERCLDLHDGAGRRVAAAA